MIAAQNLDPAQWRTWRELRLRALADAPWAFASTLARALARDSEEYWRSGICPPMVPFIVETDERASGMARLMLSDPGTPAEIISVWVAPEARGRGAGRVLIGACVDWLAEHHPTTRCRLAVVEENRPARRLYERCGFLVIGRNPEDEAELLMERGAGPMAGPVHGELPGD